MANYSPRNERYIQAYRSPLGDDDRLLLADISVWWGQIDTQLNYLLFSLYRLDTETFNHLFSGTMTQRKVEAIKVAAGRARNDMVQARIKDLTIAVGECVVDRNTVAHGMWGWTWDKIDETWKVAAWSQVKKKLFFARDLPGLHWKVLEASRITEDVFQGQVCDNIGGMRVRQPSVVGIDDARGLPPIPN